MTTRIRILQEFSQLSGEEQADVLRLVESLGKAGTSNGVATNSFGLWADLGVDLSAADIDLTFHS